MLLLFLKRWSISVSFRVHNSVQFLGAWEDEEEDELQEGSGESVSVGAAVGAVGQLSVRATRFALLATILAGDEQS